MNGLPQSLELQQAQSAVTILTSDPDITRQIKLAEKIAPKNITVLITGETGTGKDMFAQLIHERSQRTGAYVPINCGALPESLAESLLFGVEKGAFTGAALARPGYIEAANEGTLFLDEVGDLPLGLQVKLLRVLEGKGFERLGSTKPIEPSCRIVSATNADLKKKVKEGKFREDLYARLNIFPINIKPLRERNDDVPLLAKHFLEAFSAKHQITTQHFSRPTMTALKAFHWPANVRELQNVVERAVLMTDTPVVEIQMDDLKNPENAPSLDNWDGVLSGNLQSCIDALIARALKEDLLPGKLMTEFEKALYLGVFKKNNYSKLMTAQDFGINRSTLYKRVQALGITGIPVGEPRGFPGSASAPASGPQ